MTVQQYGGDDSTTGMMVGRGQGYITARVGGPVGLSPPLFFILAGKSKFEEQRKRGKNYQKTDGPRTDDTTISASTNKMKLVRFYSPAIRLQRQNI